MVIGGEDRRLGDRRQKTGRRGKAACLGHIPFSLIFCLLSWSEAVFCLPNGSPFRLDVGVDADDDGLAVDFGFGGLVAVAAGDRERLAGCRQARGVQRDFNVQDVVLDGCFHDVRCCFASVRWWMMAVWMGSFMGG